MTILYSLLQIIKDWPKLSLFILGGMGALAFAPFQFYPILILSFSGFLFLMDQSPFKESPFKHAFIFSYGYYLFNLYWIGNSLLVYDLWYLVPIFWIALPSFIAIFQASAYWAVTRYTQQPLAKILLLAVSWSLMDYIKGTYILGGFPWNLYGYIWGSAVLQSTSIIGIYGLSLLTALLLFSFASRSLPFITACACSFIGLFIWGQNTLKNDATQLTGINVRLIQPSISQDSKWLETNFRDNFEKHLNISLLDGERPLNLIIWPEASVPSFIEKYPILKDAIADVAPENGYVLVGGPRSDDYNDSQTKKIYTSSFAISSDRKVLDTFDKTHLVPFGEYMPFKDYLPIKKLTPGEMDYSPGEGLKAIHLDGIPSFTPLICFEAIFPGKVTPSSERPEWLLNQTNDAWYGNSTGPYQHLQIVRVRAIEEGLPLIRSANNGISAVIDPYGRILSQLGLDDIGFVDFELPKPIEPTFYSHYKEKPYFILLVLLSIWGILLHTLKRRNQNHS